MKLNNQVIAEAAEYVSEYLARELKKEFCYHDFFHTFSVVNVTAMLCDACHVTAAEKRILLTAAWFHDTGYTQQIEGHETCGAWIAEKFLKYKDVDEEDVEKVKACILATQYPQRPGNLLEQIICDADMFHLNESNFNERARLLREEWESTKNLRFSERDWYELNIDFLTGHTFHTDPCRKQFDNARAKNLKLVQGQLKQLGPVAEANHKAAGVNQQKGKKDKAPRPERSAETFFRLASGNHMKLSDMADNKAHILLNINSIIISVVLSVLVKNLSELTYLVLPTIVLLSVCIATIVFAVLTTKPKISKGVFTAEQIHNRETNLFFFGNFYKMGYESYEWGVQEMVYDKHYLYKSMTKDIYFLGKVLAAKCRYLSIGNRVFMFGLIASVIAFAVSFYFAH